MIEPRKFIIFLFISILLFYMMRLLLFTKKKWRFNTPTFILLLSGIFFVFIASFLDMLSNIIDTPTIYSIIKVFFTIGAIIYVIGIIKWTKLTIEMMNNLEMITLRDCFTGVLNRSGIEKSFNSTVKANNPFYILVCDLNGTKKINDTYGHIEGDKYILNTTKIITNIIGLKGNLARIGGDEFVILLEYISSSELESIIFNIKKQVSEIYPKENTGISIGYSTFPSNGKHFKDLIECADKKMYCDKKNRPSQNKY